MGKYGLHPDRVNELRYFCRQYGRKARAVADSYDLSSPPFDAPVQGGLPSNPTQQKALDNMRDKADVKAIDDCLKEVCEGEENLIIPLKKAVTEGLSYYRVGIVYENKDSFYLRRRRFFYLLDRKLRERGIT